MKYFVSSDIHSFYAPWMQALNEAGFDKNNPGHMLIVCGDIFDRGNETNSVYEFVSEMASKGKLVYIRGNHENLLKDCNKQIKCGQVPSSHHWHNGTVKTICQLCGVASEWILFDPTWTDKICETIESVLDFIDKHCKNYYETKNYVFVHSTLPTTSSDWNEAMWKNPFCDFVPVGGKTVVFGHYHTSWARHHFEDKDEFGPNADFSPYYGDGYIGIDSCVAYSGKVNVLVLEDDEV